MKLELPSQEPMLRAERAQLIEIDDGVILKRGRVEIKINGERAAEVVQTLFALTAEHGATREEIYRHFASPDRPAVEDLIRELEARRILVPANGEVSAVKSLESSFDIFNWHFGEQTAQVVKKLNSQTTVIIGINCISRQLAASLAALGMENFKVVDYPLLCNLRLFNDDGGLMADQWPASLKRPLDYKEWASSIRSEILGCVIATSDFGGQQLMRNWNEFCVKQNCNFLPVVLQDLVGYVGPLVVPGETACLECLRARQNSQMEDPNLRRTAESSAFEGQAVTGFHPSMASILGDIAAIELTKFYGGLMPSKMVGRLIEVNLLATQLVTRKVLKVPRCPVCSPLNTRSSTALDKNMFMPVNEVNV